VTNAKPGNCVSDQRITMSRDMRKQLNSLIECSICTGIFNDPRLLPCAHTYCFQCIKNFSKDKLPGDLVTCPLCRKTVALPDNGIDGLPKNFFIEQFKDLAGQSSGHCEKCCDHVTDSSLRKQAVTYCVECQQRFCEACAEFHRRAKISREHGLINHGVDDNVHERIQNNRVASSVTNTRQKSFKCFARLVGKRYAKRVLLRRTNLMNVPMLMKSSMSFDSR
jgi:hypothetical protein